MYDYLWMIPPVLISITVGVVVVRGVQAVLDLGKTVQERVR